MTPFRSLASRWYLLAALSIAACVPPNGSWPSQPGWQPQPQQEQELPSEHAAYGGEGEDAYGVDDDAADQLPVQRSPAYGRGAEQRAPTNARGGGGQWLCAAEATLEENNDGSLSDSPLSSRGGGYSRDDAYLDALRNCHALVRTEMSLAGGRRINYKTDCHVTECIGQ